MKQFALGFVTAIAVLGLGAWSYLKLGLAGVQADESAPHWENRLMSSAVRASVHRSAAKLQSKVPTRDENLVAGGKLYLDGCAGCHGELGKPPRPHRILYTPIPQLPEVGTQYSNAEVFWVVKHGIRRTGMSAYGPFYSEEQIWDIAAFIEHIKNLPPGVLERIQSKDLKTQEIASRLSRFTRRRLKSTLLTPTQPKASELPLALPPREVVPALVDFPRVRGRRSRAIRGVEAVSQEFPLDFLANLHKYRANSRVVGYSYLIRLWKSPP